MTMEKLNDEELDMVTGGDAHEFGQLTRYTGEKEIGAIGDWLKANLNIDCSLNNSPLGKKNTYSITTNGEKRTLKHEEVLSMIVEYRKQHTSV